MSSLLDGLGYEKQSKTTNTTNDTQFDIIKASVNKAIHEHLLENFPEFYHDCSGTEIAKRDKDGNVKGDSVVNGSNTYRVLMPIEEKVTLMVGNNKKVLANACRVGKPTMYSEGIQNWITEYVKINGKTHLWNKKEGKFTLDTKK